MGQSINQSSSLYCSTKHLALGCDEALALSLGPLMPLPAIHSTLENTDKGPDTVLDMNKQMQINKWTGLFPFHSHS